MQSSEKSGWDESTSHLVPCARSAELARFSLQNSLNLGYGGGGGGGVGGGGGGGGGLQVPGVPASLKSLLAQRRMPLPAEFDLSPPPGGLYSAGGRFGSGGGGSPRGERPPPPPAGLARDQRAIEQAAKQHRSAASVYDATCTWSGQLPKRVHRNPVYSCKVRRLLITGVLGCG